MIDQAFLERFNGAHGTSVQEGQTVEMEWERGMPPKIWIDGVLQPLPDPPAYKRRAPMTVFYQYDNGDIEPKVLQ